jgi:CubicO group peptidase (beta-lactamase class C family)
MFTEFQKTLRQSAVIFAVCLFTFTLTNAQSLPAAPPQTVGMNAARLDQIGALIEKDIAEKKLPGAVVVVGHKGKIVYRKAFGNRALVPQPEKMTVDTIFDVASLTKPIATATSIMILVEQGKLRLSDTVGRFIPEIEDEQAKRVTVQQLLTHTSGYRPDFDLGEKWTGREGMLAALKVERLRNPPGTRFVYSDIGFIVLGEIINRVGLEVLNQFSEDSIFGQIKMNDSNFWPITPNEIRKVVPRPISSATGLISRVAPTENVKGQNNYLGAKFEGDEKTGNQMLRGQVHDPTANRMNGVAGHAGLFSTADDLARYCQMMLNGGVLDGKRVFCRRRPSRG